MLTAGPGGGAPGPACASPRGREGRASAARVTLSRGRTRRWRLSPRIAPPGSAGCATRSGTGLRRHRPRLPFVCAARGAVRGGRTALPVRWRPACTPRCPGPEGWAGAGRRGECGPGCAGAAGSPSQVRGRLHLRHFCRFSRQLCRPLCGRPRPVSGSRPVLKQKTSWMSRLRRRQRVGARPGTGSH